VAKRKQILARKLISAMDLPEDVILDLPQLKFIGNMELVVENHKGLYEYTSSWVKLNVKGCLVSIVGKNLWIQFIGRDDIKIKGRIDKVEFQQ